MTANPKYYLADVPQDLRRRVLDLCFKRLWHDGLELLSQNGIHHYNQDDLMNFYSWAPTFLPDPAPHRGCVPQPLRQPQCSPDIIPAPTGQPRMDISPAPPTPTTDDTSPERGAHAASPADETSRQLHEARQHLVNLLARTNYRSADSLSAPSEPRTTNYER